ncbi:hypothetical protein Ddye_014155 [Dipteronia dyeriana]|uniref:Nuclear pore complex protein NUP96 C-terminal domain-containing protein n=1 Tax=Dipteronia dyeriana TaxID=168575 RepID=A0AAD9X7N4_9ROSI|nr:hypothetical protein Ddye_014155 [Dipteronia dyeriana]
MSSSTKGHFDLSHTILCFFMPVERSMLIREILFQYCESLSSQESQHQFIEELGVPLEWLHEAMAIYYNYYGNLSKALEHFLEFANWQKAYRIFVTSVAHTLFLSANHSEVWKITTSMENHKSEFENWDLGARIYISFYLIRSSWILLRAKMMLGGRLLVEARVAYSNMAEEICDLLLSELLRHHLQHYNSFVRRSRSSSLSVKARDANMSKRNVNRVATADIKSDPMILQFTRRILSDYSINL